jgi:TonB-linked SusC/RagA family outer membrane protein
MIKTKQFKLSKFLLGFVCLLLFPALAFGQRTITGKVTDATNNEPLIGSTVQVKGTTVGTVTDMEGTYRIEVSGGEDVLVFSYVGYESTEVEVGDRTEINISLDLSATELEDVVVIGYGTVKKSDLTGSVAVVTAEELTRTPASNFQTALQGKAPGVIVSQTSGKPGSGPAIRIRGIGSINRNSDPMYVVDGVVYGSLQSINPQDIESMQILKDASAAAIYGADGANGVVIITTKRGQSGKPKISYGSYYSINRVPRRLDLMNADQYAGFYNEVNSLAGINQLAYTDEFREWYYGPGWETGTDWQDQISQTGHIHDQYIRVSGGGENSNFSISGNYNDEKGILVNTGATRYSFRANSDFRIGEKLRIGETFNVSRRREYEGNGGFGSPNTATPLMKVYNPENKEGYEGPQIGLAWDPDGDGVTDDLDGDGVPDIIANTGGNDKPNPLAYAMIPEQNYYDNDLLGNLYLEYDIFDWLQYRISGSVSVGTDRDKEWEPSFDLGVRSQNQAELEEVYRESIELQLENQLTFKKQFGLHNVTATAVHQIRKRDGTSITGIARGFVYENLNVLDQANPDGVQIRGRENIFRQESYLGRLIYDYSNKYFLTASIRRDGVSRFGPGNRYGTFPSLSLAWKVNEDFMRNIDQINMFKLRFGWGTTGNSRIGDFGYDDFLNAATDFSTVLGMPNVVQPGVNVYSSFANPLIKWEAAEMINLGTDIYAFENKIQALIEYYWKNQDDLLVRIPASKVIGRQNNPWANIGKIQNRGLEMSLRYKNYNNPFRYSVSVNFTTVHNEVISLPTNEISGNNTRTVEGMPIGSLYGHIAERILTREDFELDDNGDLVVTDDGLYVYKHALPTNGVPEPGDLKFTDINGDGIIDDGDRTFIGKALPDYLAGINFEASWKNIDFSLFLNGMFNYQVYNRQYATLASFVSQDINHNKLVEWSENYYRLDRPTTEWVRADLGNSNENDRISTWWIEDASFLRIKDIQIGYTLPASLLNQIGFRSTRIYFSAVNPYIFTNYKGRDPENGAFSRPLHSGTDNGGFPNPRMLTFGIQVEL